MRGLCHVITLPIILYTRGMRPFVWKLKSIVSHEGLHIASHPNDKGCWYNLMVELGTGGTTKESITIVIGCDNITCDFYVDDSQEKGE